jgi:hypothetical protein
MVSKGGFVVAAAAGSFPDELGGRILPSWSEEGFWEWRGLVRTVECDWAPLCVRGRPQDAGGNGPRHKKIGPNLARSLRPSYSMLFCH